MHVITEIENGYFVIWNCLCKISITLLITESRLRKTFICFVLRMWIILHLAHILKTCFTFRIIHRNIRSTFDGNFIDSAILNLMDIILIWMPSYLCEFIELIAWSRIHIQMHKQIVSLCIEVNFFGLLIHLWLWYFFRYFMPVLILFSVKFCTD